MSEQYIETSRFPVKGDPTKPAAKAAAELLVWAVSNHLPLHSIDEPLRVMGWYCGLRGEYWLAYSPDLRSVERVSVPVEPSMGLLMSMAIRYDHALGIPGYYDAFKDVDPAGPSHEQRLNGTISRMRQLHEEVVGKGFYHPDREEAYVTWKMGIAPWEEVK